MPGFPLLHIDELPDSSQRDSSNTNRSIWTCIDPMKKQILFACICITLFLVLLIIILQIVSTQSINKKQPPSQYPSGVNVTVPISGKTSTATTTLANCFPRSWNSTGDVVASGGYYRGLAVDEDFNVYTSDGNRQLLQKWLPGATQPINLVDGFYFGHLFFHSPTRSFYFIDMFQYYPGVYKLALGKVTPVIVVLSNGTGSALNQMQKDCRGLHVNKAGDIFVLDSNNQRVLKWTVNATFGILVAGGGGEGNGSTQLSDPRGLFVDELNSMIYVADTRNRRIQKYKDGSISGETIIDFIPHTIDKIVVSPVIDVQAIFVDGIGNVLFGGWGQIAKWTPGTKNYTTVAIGNQGSGANVKSMMALSAFAFDKLGNLYALDWINERVLKFHSTSSPCTTKTL